MKSKKEINKLISDIQDLLLKGADPEKENTVFIEEWVDLGLIAEFIINKNKRILL